MKNESRIKLWSVSEFGYGFGSLRNGVFSKFTWEKELDSRLDWSGRHGSSSAYSNKSSGFTAESVKGVVHQGVHDIHSSPGDTNFGVDLFQDFVYVESPALISAFSSGSGCWFLFSSGHFILCCVVSVIF